jgi:hypothetical protein
MVIPVRLKDAHSALPDKVKLIISSIQWINFETQPFKDAFKELLGVCDQISAKIPLVEEKEDIQAESKVDSI